MYKPIKKLGQNFLSDPEISYGMVEELEITDNDVLVEIGPGHGFITTEIVNRIAASDVELYAIEIDSRFTSKLEASYLDYRNVKIVNNDILFWLPDFTSERNIKIIGSLPYYITSPILHTVIKMKNLPTRCVFLIQKEVAKKISAKAPDASYLSSFIQAFYTVDYLADIPKEKFDPVPKVDGGIIRLNRKDIEFSAEFIRLFEGFLHKAYKNPRKMLNKAFTEDELTIGAVNSQLRPQNLNAEDWLKFFVKLHPEIS